MVENAYVEKLPNLGRYPEPRRVSTALRSRLGGITAVLAFRLCLDFAYLRYIVDKWNFVGFEIEIDFGLWVLSLLFTAVSCLPLRFDAPKASDYFTYLFVITLVCPLGVLAALGGSDFLFFSSISLSFTVIGLVGRLPTVGLPRLSFGRELWFVIVATLLASIIIYFVSKGGLSRINFDLGRMYETREAAHEMLLSGMVAFVWSWGVKIGNVSLIIYNAHRRRWLLVACLAVIQLLMFGMLNHKAIVFYPLLAYGFYRVAVARMNPAWLAIACLLVALISMAAEYLFGSDRALTWFVLRVFFMTALNHFEYFQFFNDNVHTLFSNSFLSGIVPYVYERPIPEIIGHGRWQEGESAFANTGFMATGYMHCGYPCVAGYAGIAGFFFWLINALAVGYANRAIAIGFVAVPIWLLRSVDLGAGFVTHGLAFAMIGAWLVSGYRRP